MSRQSKRFKKYLYLKGLSGKSLIHQAVERSGICDFFIKSIPQYRGEITIEDVKEWKRKLCKAGIPLSNGFVNLSSEQQKTLWY